MKITGLCRAMAVAGIVALVGIPGAQASPIEHAVDAAGVSSGYVDLAYGDHTVNASLANNYEIDSYHFSANAGDEIKLLLHTQTVGIDAVAVLRDAMGTVVNSTSCSGWHWVSTLSRQGWDPNLCSATFDQTISSSGVFTLNFSDSGSNNAGNYELHIEQHPPVNNWVGFAYATPTTDTVDHATDMDFWAFQGTAGTGARFTIGANSGNIDPYVEIWDPSGVSFKTLSCSGNGCTNSADLDFTVTGIYKVSVNDGGLDEVGNYTLGVNCLYGSCSLSAPVAAVPEPEAYALMLAGLGLIGFMVRRRV